MKNLLAVLLFFFVAIVCSGQVRLQVDEEGMYRAKPDTVKWVDVEEITSHPKAMMYSKHFAQLISNPGEKILVERREWLLKLKLLFKQEVAMQECFIVYNDKIKNIDYIEAEPTKEEKSSYLIVFIGISILSMFLSNILFKKESQVPAAILAGCAFAFSFLFLLIQIALYKDFIPIFTVFAGLFSAFFATLAVVAHELSNYKLKYKTASAAFYVTTAVYVIALLL